MLLAEVPFVPVYTYVTKRMVNPRLQGWQSNVMDHHYSKNMFFLRAASDEPAPVITDEAGVSTDIEAEITEADSSAIDGNEETVLPVGKAEETGTEEVIETEKDTPTDPGDPDA